MKVQPPPRPPRRPYRMQARAEATRATRERIVDVALEHFRDRPYDDVRLAAVARDAGVAHQTLINHFASKEGLLEAAVDRPGPLRFRSGHRDPVTAVVAAYEVGGDAAVRLLALEERLPVLGAFRARARASHRAWVEEAFGGRMPSAGPERERAILLHVAATDLHVWKLLRREMGLSRAATIDAMRAMVGGLS